MNFLCFGHSQAKRAGCNFRNYARAIHLGLGVCILVVHSGAAAPLVANSSFETPLVGPCPALAYMPPNAEWIFVSGGITTAGCGRRFNAPQPPAGGGGQVAFIQNGSLSQMVTGFEIGRKYQITFYAAGRPQGAGCNNNCSALNFSVFAGLNDVLDVVSPPTDAFQHYATRVFTADSNSLVIKFAGLAVPGVDGTAFIDLVAVQGDQFLSPTESAPAITTPVPSAATQGKVCGSKAIRDAMQLLQQQEMKDPNGLFMSALAGILTGVDTSPGRADIIDSKIGSDNGRYTSKDPGSFVCRGLFIRIASDKPISDDSNLSPADVQKIIQAYPSFVEWFKVKQIDRSRYRLTLLSSSIQLARPYITDFTLP